MLRQAHEAFEDPEFGESLLNVLQDRLAMVEGNWNEYYAIDLLVTIGLRLLTLLNDSFPISQIVDFIRQCREVAIRWCTQLSHGLSGCSEDNSGRRQQMIIQIASTCQASYDADPEHIKSIFNSPRDLVCFVRSSVFLFENTPADLARLPRHVRSQLENSRRICCSLRRALHFQIKAYPVALSQAIEQSLGCLELCPSWHFLNDEWMNTTTKRTSQGRQQQIYYNILTGELLVDGHPPGRLPGEFIQSPPYYRLFGSVRFSPILSEQ